MKKAFPIFAIVTGLYWIFMSFGYGLWVRRGPGGGFFPLVGGALAVVFSLLYLRAEMKKPGQESGFDPRFLYPILSVLAVLLLSYVFGLLPCMLAFIFLWLWRYEKYPAGFSACVSVGTMLVLYAVFVWWLSVQMPSGIVGAQVMDWWHGAGTGIQEG